MAFIGSSRLKPAPDEDHPHSRAGLPPVEAARKRYGDCHYCRDKNLRHRKGSSGACLVTDLIPVRRI
jgi:hypothetical protein